MLKPQSATFESAISIGWGERPVCLAAHNPPCFICPVLKVSLMNLWIYLFKQNKAFSDLLEGKFHSETLTKKYLLSDGRVSLTEALESSTTH